MAFEELFGTADPDERRRWRRYLLPGGVRADVELGGRKHRVDVHNISLGGARFDAEEALPASVGQEVLIVTKEPFSGTVRWQRDRSFGVEFDYSEAALQFVSHCLTPLVENYGKSKDPGG